MKRRYSRKFKHHIFGLGTAVTLIAAPIGATAQGVLTDGWTGPVAMDGHTLDHAMAALNEFVATKQAQSDMMASLHEAPSGDFAEVALASARTPLDRSEFELNSFGWPISGGMSLDQHLVAFNEDMSERGDSLFLKIARAEADTNLDFGTVASDVHLGAIDGGRIYDDVTLDQEMISLREGMREFDDRLSRLSRSVPDVTGTSFDRYVESLALF
ncbi:hypothetical protein [Celeribacter litoreus]|uniref:hypothetical protein n=1 Tax=Celeribacter litoreus TaxID=2876714 RepID=UPI001CCF80CF|nr:hypothetical protein [Celeribacter litoreus]MCA0042745.1 hypothetical protein [Celeribacter litoreus]